MGIKKAGNGFLKEKTIQEEISESCDFTGCIQEAV
jgi:hypothetical protein